MSRSKLDDFFDFLLRAKTHHELIGDISALRYLDAVPHDASCNIESFNETLKLTHDNTRSRGSIVLPLTSAELRVALHAYNQHCTEVGALRSRFASLDRQPPPDQL